MKTTTKNQFVERLVVGIIVTAIVMFLNCCVAPAQVPQGAVHVQTNSLIENEIAAFGRNLDGPFIDLFVQ